LCQKFFQKVNDHLNEMACGYLLIKISPDLFIRENDDITVFQVNITRPRWVSFQLVILGVAIFPIKKMASNQKIGVVYGLLTPLPVDSPHLVNKKKIKVWVWPPNTDPHQEPTQRVLRCYWFLLHASALRNGQRVREVRQGPDGFLYGLTDDPYGSLIRLEPTG
jgi:hypothetical protein